MGKAGPTGFGSSTTAEQIASSWDGAGKVSHLMLTFPHSAVVRVMMAPQGLSRAKPQQPQLQVQLTESHQAACCLYELDAVGAAVLFSATCM
jgi:hypothetical protein